MLREFGWQAIEFLSRRRTSIVVLRGARSHRAAPTDHIIIVLPPDAPTEPVRRLVSSTYPVSRGGRRRSWNHARYSCIFTRCADEACFLHVEASSLSWGAPHLS